MKEQIQVLLDTIIPSQRKSDLAVFAKKNNFSYQSRAGIEYQDFGIRSFEIIKSRYWNEFRGIITKNLPEIKASIRFYDYLRTNKVGSYVTSVVEVNANELQNSKYYIHPIPKIKKLKSLFIDPENDFFDNYEITSVYPDSIIDELGMDALDYINSIKNIYVEGEGNYFLMYHKHKKIKIFDIPNYIEMAIELLELMSSDYSSQSNHEFV